MHIKLIENSEAVTIKSILKLYSFVIALILVGQFSYADELTMEKVLADRYLSIGGEVGYRSSFSNDDRLIDIDDYYDYGLSFEAKFSDLYSLYFLMTDAEPEINGSNDNIEYKGFSLMFRRFLKQDGTDPSCCWRPFFGIGYSYRDIEYISTVESRLLFDESDMGLLSVGIQRRLGHYFLIESGLRVGVDFEDSNAEINPFIGLKVVLPIYKARMIQAADSQREPIIVDVVENSVLDQDEDGVLDSVDQCLLTPSGALVDEDGCAKVLNRTVRQDLEILFESNKAKVKPSSFSEIKRVGDVMKQFPATRVTIIGHTDSTGRSETNLILSLSRASGVRDVLINEFGIAPNRVEIVGRGETEPKYDNLTAENRRLNRRVEAVVETSYSIMQMRER